MRKNQKKHVETFLPLFKQLHDLIIEAVENSYYQEVLKLFEQCQKEAIELGKLIEISESSDFITITILEDYCELVYEIYQKTIQGNKINIEEIKKLLMESFVKISNSIKNDIIVKYEVVFLPYKASMWDSMESVWKAAVMDLNCNVYVIPIPYYKKGGKIENKEMHFEGNLYPSYVPITNYETFDFAFHKPDLIIIHNPYDGGNRVTSVDSFFYAKNLKKYTEMLVYIPYFVLDEIVVDNQNMINGIENLCLLPGVFYADKTIVQSENMRDIYIRILTKYVNKKEHWENKIIGIGSPKIDKVLNYNRENVEFPGTWEKIINKEDGSRKKIILYNTSVRSFLIKKEKMLDKIANVFSCFENNQKEMILLWRPHPLLRATLESMYPLLLEQYDAIVKNYKEKQYGIYDDTSDMNRAIAISDAYYGDPSSLVQIYQLTGKPIMIQNTDIFLENEEGICRLYENSICNI